MNELDRRGRHRKGLALAGFMVPFALLVLVALGYERRFGSDIGWRGGEYACAFIGVASGSVLVGILLRLRPQSPWQRFGTGLIVAGTLGVVCTVVIVVLVVIVMS